ncbi:hypothetical protein ACTA71_001835 [Dictyostelium dimigraforme]
MKKEIHIFLIIFLSIFGIQISLSQIPPIYDCLYSLTTKSEEIKNIPFNTTTKRYDFCKFYSCSKDGTLDFGNFKANTSIVFSQKDFGCLSGINKMYLTSFTLESDFVTALGLPTTLTTLQIYNSPGIRVNSPVFPWLKSYINYISEDLTDVILHLDTTKNNTCKFNYIDDLTSPKMVNGWGFALTSIPEIKNIYSTEPISLYGNPIYFNESSFVNFEGYRNFGGISFQMSHYLKKFQFPISITNLKDSTIRSILLVMSFTNPSSFISLKDLKSLNDFETTSVSSQFQINGNIPFDLSTIPSNLTRFVFKNSDLYLGGLPDVMFGFRNVEVLSLANNNITGFLPKEWNTKSKIKELDLSGNHLKGTIDESYCFLRSLKLASNNLNGTIPSCFSCYLTSIKQFQDYDGLAFTYGFFGNQFIGINLDNDQPPCMTIMPNLKFDPLLNRIYLFGKDLGFGPRYFTISDPLLSFILDTPSILYYANSPAPLKGSFIDFKFKSSKTIFRLSANPFPPSPTNISIIDNVITIDGTYFNYNTSTISIKVGENNCTVLTSTFYQIICSIDGVDTSTILDPNVPGSINVGDLVSLVQFPIRNNSNVDEFCQSLSFCSYNGICSDNQCVCDKYHELDDCSGIKCPDKVCSNHGVCNTDSLVCQCEKGYLGDYCDLADHYASSILQVDNTTITLFGWFGNIHDQLTITIGSTPCTSILASNDSLICTLSNKPSNGFNHVYINQNAIEWIGKNMYKYQDGVLAVPCYNNCSKNGICDTVIGKCACNKGFSGLDCSSKSRNNNGNDDDDISIGSVSDGAISKITNSETVFEIMINKIIEYSFDGKIIKEWNLNNKWIRNTLSETSNSNIYSFNQTLSGTKCLIVYTIEQINSTDKESSFAGYKYSIEKGSLKMTISIENYPYSSTLNNLQIQMESQVGTKENNNSSNSKCNDQNTEIRDSINDDVFNFISIKKNAKQMYGRFLSVLLSNGRPTSMTTSIISNEKDSIILGFNLPHCNQCLIDPDFSVLLSTEFKSSCDEDNNNGNNSGRKSYVIPVAVVVSVFGVAAIVGTIFFIKKKKQEKITMLKLQRFGK